jgi:hypothetical protein
MSTQHPLFYRVLHDARDGTVLEFCLPNEPRGVVHLLVAWEPDRDQRLIQLLVALRYRDPRALAVLTGVAEHRGVVDAWITSAEQAVEVHRALSAAADIAIQPGDRWIVNTPQAVATRNGVVDRDSLPLDHPLLAAPAKFTLGCKPAVRS